MALTKQVLSWPIVGGLDSSNSPLVIQPGSHLTLDNVMSERLGEWKNRNGFTQIAADTIPSMPTGPSMVANFGATGMVALDWESAQVMMPNATTSKWKQSGTRPVAVDDLERESIALTARAASSFVSFSSDGSTHIATVVQESSPSAQTVSMVLFDSNGSTSLFFPLILTSVAGSCRSTAGPAGFLTTFFTDSSGNLWAQGAKTTDMTFTTQTLVKAGVNPIITANFDAMYYTGSTITIVANMVAGGYQFIEWDPSTLTKTVDVNIAAGTTVVLACIMEPFNSGTRMIGMSTTTTTRVYRLNSSGTVLTTDTVEAVASTAITGCASNGGTDWAVVYSLNTLVLRRNAKVTGVVGTPANLQHITAVSSSPIALAGQGWGEPGDDKWFFLISGNRTLFGSDPQSNTMLVTNRFVQNNVSYSLDIEIVSGVAQQQGPMSILGTAGLWQAVRTGVRSFYFGMPILSKFSPLPNLLGAWSEYEMTAFDHTLLSSAELGTVNVGAPCYRGNIAILPANSLRFFDGVNTGFITAPCLQSIGLQFPVRSPNSLTPSTAGGNLTLLSTYQWCWQIDIPNDDSQTWRSGPSVPATVTLTGTQNTVSVVFSPWQYESFIQKARLKLFRTNGNGSVFRLVNEFAYLLMPTGDFTYVDVSSDASIAGNEILYTTGEQANIPWTPTSHCWMFDDRLFALNRDFRTEIQYSKNLQANRQPETTAQNVLDLDDQFGDVTNGCSVDSTCVVFKRNAIYFIQGSTSTAGGGQGGFDNAGTGSNYTTVLVSQDIGSLPGTPVVVAGAEVYFVSERGIYSIDRAANVKFVGAPVDQYLNQPQVQAKEQVFDAVFAPGPNEVRFVTTNYVLVYDRNFDLWTRWTSAAWGGTIRRCLLVNGKMVLFGNNGLVWREGTESQTTDQGVAFNGIIRSAWIRPKEFGQIKLWKTLATALRTSGGGNITPTMQLFTDDSDVQVQSWSPPAVIAGATTPIHMEARPQVMNCSSFSVQVTLPSGDTTFRLEQLGAEFGLRSGGAQRRPASERWG